VVTISTNADRFEIEVHLLIEARRQCVTNNFQSKQIILKAANSFKKLF